VLFSTAVFCVLRFGPLTKTRVVVVKQQQQQQQQQSS